MDTKKSHDHGPPELRHEVRDITVRPIVAFGIALSLIVAVSLLLMRGLFNSFEKGASQTDSNATAILAERPSPHPPEPRLQTAPVPARKQILENENSLLNSYGWVDQRTGVVHIPIQQAMELLAKRGLPARPEDGVQKAEGNAQQPGSGKREEDSVSAEKSQGR